MRGKDVELFALFVHHGITPAYAGKSAVLLMCSCHSRGSPPHVRGKGNGLFQVCELVRITPACAGKRRFILNNQRSCKDHPRMCGENWSCTSVPPRPVGSPPHVRGKARRARLFEVLRGITPAHAGKSTRGTDAHKRAEDHPRVCGEKKTAENRAQVINGSPPRMRGKGILTLRTNGCMRITPAYAGKSTVRRT